MPTPQQRRMMMGGNKYVTLPQNLLLNPGTLYEDFEAQADWTNEAGSHADNSTQFLSGAKSQKLTSLSGSNGRIKKAVDWNLSDFGRMLGYVYVHDALADYSGSLIVQLFNEAALTNSWRAYITQNRFTSGWNIIAADQAEFTVGSGVPSWASNIKVIRVQSTGAAGKIVTASWDKFNFGLRGVPAILMSFDDGKSEIYSNCFSYMRSHNIRGSLFMPSSYVGAGTYMTAIQLYELRAAGWIIGNHTQNHTDLTTLPEAQQETELNAAITDYAAMGITHGPNKYLAYVNGNYNADTLTAMTNIGLVTGRTVYGHYNLGANPGLPTELYKLASTTVTNTTTVATVTGYIDNAIARGDILPLTFHQVGGAGQMTAADFQLVMNYIVSKQNQIYSITIDDLYNLTLGPVSVPKVT